MIYAQFGPFTFIEWTGAPQVAQTSWEMIERAGTQGVLFINCGERAAPFSAHVVADVLDWASANVLHQMWQKYTRMGPQPLTLGGFTYPNPFQLLDVSQPEMRRILAGFGGTTSPSTSTAIVRATFTLREVIPAPLPDHPTP